MKIAPLWSIAVSEDVTIRQICRCVQSVIGVFRVDVEFLQGDCPQGTGEAAGVPSQLSIGNGLDPNIF